MPRDKGQQRLSKPPAHVPTFAARGGLLGPRLLVLLLALVLGTGAVAGLFGESQPPGENGASVVLPTASPAPGTPTAGVAVESPEPTDSGPIGAPLPDPTATPQPPKQVRPTSAPPEELTGYQWPLRGARITSRFGSRGFGGFVLIDGEEVHDGLDLARFCGFKVRAAHDGVVLYAGRKFDDYIGYKGSAAGIYSRLERQGRMRSLPIVVVIDDGNGYRSMYVHLSKTDVEAGDVVKAGDVIGREGDTGYATGCHLHYTLIRMDGPWQEVVPQLHQYGYPELVRERVDPLRVLPWDDPHAPERLRERVSPVSPSPQASPSVEPSAESPAGPSPGPAGPAEPSPSARPSG
jgi:murein DD-endopeptidase MepM/ murein hydrolase activator NlpD